MAEAFDTAGFEAWVTDVDQTALNAVPSHWRGHLCDAASEPQMKALFEKIKVAGGLDVLCAQMPGLPGQRRWSKTWHWQTGAPA